MPRVHKAEAIDVWRIFRDMLHDDSVCTVVDGAPPQLRGTNALVLYCCTMCNTQCVEFARSSIRTEDVRGCRVLEVGSFDYNGSVRRIAEAFEPQEYLGVDIEPGPGVDEICAVESLVERYGANAFDLVICTEMLEHVADWRSAVWNLKSVVRPGGALILTTRSRGFYFHGYPGDYWRFEIEDMRLIFADMDVELLESDDVTSPGVFIRARRTGTPLSSADLRGIALYSIVRRHRLLRAAPIDEIAAKAMARSKRVAHRVTPTRLKGLVRKAINAVAR